MKGKLLCKALSKANPSCAVVLVDLDDKSTIRTLEKTVKATTGLNWMITDTTGGESYINWKLLLPIRGGKLEIKAQSNKSDPTRIYGFQVEDDDFFMKALKQIEAKR